MKASGMKNDINIDDCLPRTNIEDDGTYDDTEWDEDRGKYR